MRYIALVATVLMAATALAETNALHGAWTTGPVLSQLGMVVTEKDFRADGTIATRVQFLQMTNVPPMVMTGRYSVADGKLVTIVKGGTNEMPFMIEGDTLILREGRNKDTPLKRKKD